ncbi:hypothetical protein FNV43_RR06950 [Rhamnella rubrinervis]|uniref:Uncharacterized protein n=1 Tax=Rhamnella rubrinervis TaxID=2594499 RepID=A0A8K0MLR3_9ROSA|nr:hypothetical protein FNV43_RR06950 [Rhamnella rubrinervis]
MRVEFLAMNDANVGSIAGIQIQDKEVSEDGRGYIITTDGSLSSLGCISANVVESTHNKRSLSWSSILRQQHHLCHQRRPTVSGMLSIEYGNPKPIHPQQKQPELVINPPATASPLPPETASATVSGMLSTAGHLHPKQPETASATVSGMLSTAGHLHSAS